ncbi:hypothetical protein BJI49_12640 [Acetobacter pasteurianus]|uniref:hypothetical protein n=1 Tax=Acetobacter pasteurianus TaxID=438 RepID=UPI0002458272|nr:hypothetical protein [Acetobacter pasteurianus]RCL04683.1 hypothetical protein BJI49_12640 [Acetobacter pasteurianus]GAB32101.1 hypothetical protein APS_2703 [Acetobacter pasteurianus subsp. pasteurianus LMG 1262 = NBRC 106471]GCD50350.1 hypothetical protein NBRC106471_1906 [Acetobacter pasteurianus subsp. pasteurianus LMG 1262 = NBRC 106471]
MYPDDEEVSVSLTQFEELQRKVVSLEYAVRALFVAASRIDNPDLFRRDFQKEMDRQIDKDIQNGARALKRHIQGDPSAEADAMNLPDLASEACNLRTYVSTGKHEEAESENADDYVLPSCLSKQGQKDLKDLEGLLKAQAPQLDQED